MQEKLLEILSDARGWMAANEIAEKGKWRSAAHVGLALKQMKGVDHRKSATKKMGNGMPATEYKLAEKNFGDDAPSTKSEPISSKLLDMPVCTKSQTESKIKQPSPVVTQPDHGNEVADLRAKLALAEQQRDSHFAEAEEAQRKLADLEDDIRRQTQRAGLAEQNRDDLKTLLNNAEATNIRWIDAARHELIIRPEDLLGFLGRLRLQLEFVDGESIEQKVAQVMHERIHDKQRIADLESAAGLQQPETTSAEAVDVKDAAVGYLVRIPGKKTRICIKPTNAREAALSGARVHGRADVLALVPVGKAVRGAEWKEAS